MGFPLREEFLEMEYLNSQIRKFTGTIYRPRQASRRKEEEAGGERLRRKIMMISRGEMWKEVERQGYKPKSKCHRRGDLVIRVESKH